MFHVHSAVVWLAPEMKTKSLTYFNYSMKLSGMVAPVFMFLAGVSIGLFALRQQNLNRDVRRAKLSVTRRGLQILLLGYGLHFLFYLFSGEWSNWLRIFKVDILHCIGLTIAMAPWIAWPKRVFNISALLLFITIPMLSMLFYRLPIAEHLPIGLAAYIVTTTRLALFPIVPYMAWAMLGLFIAPIYTHSLENENQERGFWFGIVAAAIAMWFTGSGLKTLYYTLSLDRLGTDTPQVKGLPHFFWQKGAIVIGLFSLSRFTTSLLDSIKVPFLTRFGRRSLFAYCLHLFMIYPLLGPHLRQRLSPREHLFSTVALVLCMYLLVTSYDIVSNRIVRIIARRTSSQ